MRQFEEDRYIRYIAFALAIGHAVPLYAYSMGWFNILISLFAFPVIGDLIALYLALSVRGQGAGLKVGKWTGRLAITAGVIYLVLLIGSFFIGQREVMRWNTFALITLPFVASWFLIMSFLTGVIIHGPEK